MYFTKKKIDFTRILWSRITSIFLLIIINKNEHAKHSSLNIIIINFYKNVNIYFHAIFSFNTFLLFITKKEENRNNRNNNYNNYNNNNNNNDNESNGDESDKNKNKRNNDNENK